MYTLKMKVRIVFKWERDENYETICDDFEEIQTILDALLKENEDAITPRILREIHQKIQDEKDVRGRYVLAGFLKEMDNVDEVTMPRYAHYVKDMLQYGPYDRSNIPQPVNEETYATLMNTKVSEYGFEVILNIPDDNVPTDVDFMGRMIEFNEILPDTLWEGAPGSTAVYYNGSVIGFYCTVL
jgi:hypothetical protein